MVKIEFFKICAGGNDFAVIDNRKKFFNVEYQDNLVEMLCARRFSIGADGACFIESSSSADYMIKFFSSDGAEQNFNANGTRAAIRFTSEKEIAGNKQQIETKSGVIKGEIIDQIISVEMPKIKKLEIKHELEIPHQFESKVVEVSMVDFGTKHLVLKVEKVSTVDIRGIGFMLANSVRYQPDGVDVTFYDLIDTHNMNIATFEVGAKNLVYSSGNGAFAAAAIAETRKEVATPLIVHTWGGLLKVTGKNSVYSVEGEARVSYTGFISSEMLNFDIEKARKRHIC
ncbi:MAG: diaminopimelate epimerase [Pseudomonadota bacterium]